MHATCPCIDLPPARAQARRLDRVSHRACGSAQPRRIERAPGVRSSAERPAARLPIFDESLANCPGDMVQDSAPRADDDASGPALGARRPGVGRDLRVSGPKAARRETLRQVGPRAASDPGAPSAAWAASDPRAASDPGAQALRRCSQRLARRACAARALTPQRFWGAGKSSPPLGRLGSIASVVSPVTASGVPHPGMRMLPASPYATDAEWQAALTRPSGAISSGIVGTVKAAHPRTWDAIRSFTRAPLGRSRWQSPDRSRRAARGRRRARLDLARSA